MMKRLKGTSLIFLLVVFFTPKLSGAMDQPHWYPTLPDGCLNCHRHGSFNPAEPCLVCHTDTPDTADPYVIPAPYVPTHSSDVIGSTKYGTWSIDCRGCHDEDKSAQLGNYTPLVQGTFSSYTETPPGGSDAIFNFTIDTLTINDPDWSDPAKWGAKTDPDRGLILWVKRASGSWYSFIVKDAASSFISARGDSFYAPFDLTAPFEIHYGQLIDDFPLPYGGSSREDVIFTGPKTFADNDGLGGDIDTDGNVDDSTPNGICQVCHTQTKYWLNDGTLGIHYSGQVCTECHDHKEGFKANCNGCHGNPPIIDIPASGDGLVLQPSPTRSSSSGAHDLHSNIYPFTCENCHYNGMPVTLIVDNNLIQIGFDIYGIDGTGTGYDGQLLDAPYDYQGTNNTVITTSGSLTCSNIYCHSDGTALSTSIISANTSPSWNSSTGINCNSCHGSVDAAPSYANGSPKANSHAAHSAYGCESCHIGTTTDGTTIAGTTNHVNGIYDVVNGPGVSLVYSFSPTGSTCSNISCHANSDATWGDPSSASCIVCHQNTVDEDDYIYGNGTVAALNNNEWTTTGHGQATAALDCFHCHDSSVAHDQSTNPFRLANNSGPLGQNGVCLICHAESGIGYDPDAEGTDFDLINATAKIESVHYGNKHLSEGGGAFCWDCHDPHGDSNFKMIHDSITISNDAIYGIPAATVAVTFTASTLSTDFVRLSAPFDGICQACHTLTNHWLQDGSGDTHFDGERCTGCHLHSSGFDPSAGEVCHGCHGAPPVEATLGGPDGLVDYPTPTGSTTAGAHPQHSNQYGYTFSCHFCHSDGMPITPIADDYKMQMGFNIWNFSGTGTSYDGQTLDPSYTYEATSGTTVTTGGSKTCSNIYCHSDGTSLATSLFTPTIYTGPDNTTPAWDSNWNILNDPDGDTCNNCHQYPPLYNHDDPKANSHFRHNQIGYTCKTCHYATTQDDSTIADSSKHHNGVYDVDPAPTFFANGQDWPLTFDYTYDAGGGTCSSNSCHDKYGTLDPYRWGKSKLYASASSSSSDICREVTVNVTVTGAFPSGSALLPYQCYYEWGDGTVQDWSEDCSGSHVYANGNNHTVTWSVRDANRHTTNGTSFTGLETMTVTPHSAVDCIDPADVDSDGDGMPDLWETSYGLNPLNSADAAFDLDGDGLTNLYEFNLGTDPTLPDTDGDGVYDGHDGYPLDDQQSVCTDTIIHYESLVSYASVGLAYASSQILTDNSIRLTASDHIEDLLFDRNIIFTLSGGYDCGFINNPVNTEISGTLAIINGTVIIDRITIR